MLAALRLEKRKQIEAMQQMVATPHCLRQLVVEAFGQTLATRPVQCCTTCGATYELHVEAEKKATLAMEASWQERLHMLLPL